MPSLRLSALSQLARIPHDTVIDVRSPAEYAEDHLPGAINLPVLSNEERARVGTIYKQVSAFDARKLGAALVSRNAAHHLETALADKSGGWRPLVYCWRGGQRSGSFASILEQIGWRVDLLEGGYRSYRRLVVQRLYESALPLNITLIDGGTGTAKTRLLWHLTDAGAQTVDLEGLARHRGSLFGALACGQPAQKMFETRLAAAIERLDPQKPVFIEAESTKIGNLLIPPSLWKQMTMAARLVLSAPVEARAAYLAEAYSDLRADPRGFARRLEKLRIYHGAEQLRLWQGMVENGDWLHLARELIEKHYDPRYRKSAHPTEALTRIDLEDLSDTTLARTAGEIAGG